jgi:hypothetical protein
VRVPSAAAPFCTSGVFSGGFRGLGSGGFVATGALTGDTFIGNILVVVSDSGDLARMIGEFVLVNASQQRQLRPVVNARLPG